MQRRYSLSQKDEVCLVMGKKVIGKKVIGKKVIDSSDQLSEVSGSKDTLLLCVCSPWRSEQNLADLIFMINADNFLIGKLGKARSLLFWTCTERYFCTLSVDSLQFTALHKRRKRIGVMNRLIFIYPAQAWGFKPIFSGIFLTANSRTQNSLISRQVCT
jgi:hypothetical protein